MGGSSGAGWTSPAVKFSGNVDLDLQRLLTLLPVAGAQFVRLHSVQHAQGFVHTAAHREIVHIHPLDDAIGVHQEARTQADLLHRVQDAQVASQLLRRDERILQRRQVFAGLLPGQVGEFIVRRTTDQLSVTIREIPDFFAKFHEFSRADKREILRVKQEELPLAGEGLAGDFGNVVIGDAIAGFGTELRKRMTDG